jgi:hypothetical protein
MIPQPQQNGNGGSLERRSGRIKVNGSDPAAFSDSEYGKLGSNPVSPVFIRGKNIFRDPLSAFIQDMFFLLFQSISFFLFKLSPSLLCYKRLSFQVVVVVDDAAVAVIVVSG